MSDVNISKYRAQVIRQGSTPASPGFAVSEGQNPVDPSGSGQNHLPVTIGSPANGLAVTDAQVLTIDKAQIFAGTSAQFVKGDGTLDSTAYGTGSVTSVGLSSATSGVTIGSSPITTSGTITLAIATASGSLNGLLSSTDWTTFNNKQNLLTNPVTGTGTTNYLSKFTGASTIGNSLIFDNGTLVGIGTANPEGKLTIEGTSTQPPTSGTTANSLLQLKGSLNNELNLGSNTVTGNYGAYIQASDNNLAVPYQLNLQPTGGNVIIGSYTDNGARLQVSGAATTMATITSSGTASGLQLTNTSGTASSWIIQSDGGAVAGQAALRFYSLTASAYRMAISGSGNVGIGVDNPAAELQVGKSSDVVIAMSNSSSVTSGNRGSLAWYNSSVSSVALIRAAAVTDNVGTELQFFTRPAAGSLTQAMTITSGGNVLIGTTTNPGFKLFVSGSGNVVGITSSDNTLSLGLGTSGTMSGYLGGTSSALYAYSTNGGYALLNSSSVWVAVSDIKRKRNFEPYTKGISAILGLQPKLYNMDFQKDGDKKQVGLVAQEVKDFIPLAYEDNAGFIGVNYNAIIVTMVKAIQELKQEIDTLKN